MLTAQLVATHNLHMRCHRLAAETESPEKLKDYGNMAAKAGRSFCGLMTTLSRHRGKAPAQVRVGDVVNESGEPTAAHAPATTSGTVADEPPMRSAHPEANALQIAIGSGKTRCRMHGGATGSGAPTGNKNALKHGRYTAEAIALRREFQALMRQNRQLIESR